MAGMQGAGVGGGGPAVKMDQFLGTASLLSSIDSESSLVCFVLALNTHTEITVFSFARFTDTSHVPDFPAHTLLSTQRKSCVCCVMEGNSSGIFGRSTSLVSVSTPVVPLCFFAVGVWWRQTHLLMQLARLQRPRFERLYPTYRLSHRQRFSSIMAAGSHNALISYVLSNAYSPPPLWCSQPRAAAHHRTHPRRRLVRRPMYP